MCQDTGTAIVMGKKGQYVLTGGGDEAAIARGVFETYQTANLRYSQIAPLDMYREVNTGNNLPAQIEIYATDGDAYKFLFMAKGGGSANKSYLYQETKALLNPDEPARVHRRQAPQRSAPPPARRTTSRSSSAAPPPSTRSRSAKLASARYLDTLPTEGNALGRGFRDLALEAEVLELAQKTGHRRAVRRQVLLPRRARHPPAPPRRLVPGRRSPSPARPIARRSARSRARASSSSSSRPIPAKYLPETTHDDLAGEVVQDRPRAGRWREIRARARAATRSRRGSR